MLAQRAIFGFEVFGPHLGRLHDVGIAVEDDEAFTGHSRLSPWRWSEGPAKRRIAPRRSFPHAPRRLGSLRQAQGFGSPASLRSAWCGPGHARRGRSRRRKRLVPEHGRFRLERLSHFPVSWPPVRAFDFSDALADKFLGS